MARLKLLFVLPLAVLLVVLTSMSTNIFAREEVEIPLPPLKSGEIVPNKDVPPPPPKATQDEDKVHKEALNAMKKESMRVVHAMPNWKPGKDKGKVVRVEYALPIAYKLDEKTKKKAE